MKNTAELGMLRASTLAFVLLLTGCGDSSNKALAPTASSSKPGEATGALQPIGGRSNTGAVSVSLATAKKRDFEVSLEAVGTVSPLSTVDVKPQTSGVVTRVHVQEGQFVKTGDLLFTLDARADESNVAKMRAQIVKGEALFADVQRQLARSKDLLVKGFISQGALDSNQSQVDAQQASLVADRAALDAALLALSYNSVRASSAGRLGAVNAFVGTAVQINQTTLVSITQLDPINVGFSLPQRYLDTILQGLKSSAMVVRARLPESKADIEGRLQFVDSTVDGATGTIKVKARFDNRGLGLWPGAFVNVSIVSQTIKSATVIPTNAIIQSSRGPVVYVAVQGKAALRPVTVLALQGDESAVSGIAAGDKVVVEGRQNVRPDSAVVERTPAGATSPRSAASSAGALP